MHVNILFAFVDLSLTFENTDFSPIFLLDDKLGRVNWVQEPRCEFSFAYFHFYI